jgi:hypothetical protein
MAEWLAEARLGETRYALVEAGTIGRLVLVRDDDGPMPGAQVSGVARAALSPKQTLVLLDDGREVVARAALREGMRVDLIICRAAIAEPSQIKRAEAVLPGALTPEPMWIGRQLADARSVAALPDAATSLMEEALLFAAALPNGGLLSWERTRAGLVCDVDSSARPQEAAQAAINLLAARLAQWGQGGTVLLDLPNLPDKAARTHIGALIDNALPSWQRAGPNGFGLVQLVAPRHGPSLLDQLCGTRRAGPSPQTQALALLQEAVTSQGVGPRTLSAAPAVINWLNTRTDLVDAARRRIGAPLILVADHTQNGYGHVHVSPLPRA